MEARGARAKLQNHRITGGKKRRRHYGDQRNDERRRQYGETVSVVVSSPTHHLSGVCFSPTFPDDAAITYLPTLCCSVEVGFVFPVHVCGSDGDCQSVFCLLLGTFII